MIRFACYKDQGTSCVGSGGQGVWRLRGQLGGWSGEGHEVEGRREDVTNPWLRQENKKHICMRHRARLQRPSQMGVTAKQGRSSQVQEEQETLGRTTQVIL